MKSARTAGTTTSVVTTKRKVKAKCAENQALVDKLVEMRENLGTNDNYSFTLKRATESLLNCREPLTSYEQAIGLKYIGDHIASKIFPRERRQEGTGAKSKLGRKRSATLSQSSVESMEAPSTTPSTSDAPMPKRARKQPEKSKQLHTIREEATIKETAYEKARDSANSWQGRNLKWKVLLIVDGRERKSEHIQSKCHMSGIPCEERFLPIGDMAWIAQGLDGSGNIVSELMLGTIVERKTVEDLKASIFGTRYSEQQLRLQTSGLPQLLFLIEGDASKDQFHCPAETLHTAVWETRLHNGFQILRTAHMDETVKTLKRIHRRILQRSFPSAFYVEGLPTFAEADARGYAARRKSQEQQDKNRRRRLQSLVEMTFDVDPVPPLGTERFISYKELKAKIELDREAGTRTIGNVHAAMMKQVATFSSAKCQAICRVYPTLAQLLAAYAMENDDRVRNELVADIQLSDPNQENQVAQARRIGSRSAAELHVALGFCSEGRTSDVSQSSGTTYSQPVARVQEIQRNGQREPLPELPTTSREETSKVAQMPNRTEANDWQRLTNLSPEPSALNGGGENCVYDLISTDDRKPAARPPQDRSSPVDHRENSYQHKYVMNLSSGTSSGSQAEATRLGGRREASSPSTCSYDINGSPEKADPYEGSAVTSILESEDDDERPPLKKSCHGNPMSRPADPIEVIEIDLQ